MEEKGRRAQDSRCPAVSLVVPWGMQGRGCSIQCQGATLVLARHAWRLVQCLVLVLVPGEQCPVPAAYAQCLV